MDMVAIFGLQIFLSVVVCSLLAKWFLAPWLREKTQRESLFWLTLPHATRHVGLVFLVPGVVAPSLPHGFAVSAAYGDLAAGVLALLVLIALRSRWAGTMALVWLFNVVGTVDLLNALRHAQAVPHLGAAWYIPTFWVPVLLVSHFMIFCRLFRKATKHGAK
ncbi:MAG: hypothetical protein O7H39_14165 [Gammaproteobacteria bacterium]|nr:hypothetical protein [Gammaproteobacteria bacterium]